MDKGNLSRIRNFSIIAHIDHGKSTLADRMLEATNAVEKRKMKEQVLDQMELERERGITIKMRPIKMQISHQGVEYTLNLIDTPGHIDFSYEVSRALRAVEGTLLLVDATQGVQAQTLSVLASAREAGLVIIPVMTKIDSPIARPDEVREEITNLLSCAPDEVRAVSGKTGEGVPELLREIIERVPPPHSEYPQGSRALVFDFEYSTHRGVIVYVRMLDGEVQKGDTLLFTQGKKKFTAIAAGVFGLELEETGSVPAGCIGYIVTGIKEPGVVSVGDTIVAAKHPLPAFPGYREPLPMVWASVYPESQDDFALLRQALLRLKLSDPSLSFEEEASDSLGRGFRCGFLGMLHLEIIMERLKREFDLELIMTTPSITYEIVRKSGGVREKVYTPTAFPDEGNIAEVYEPWVRGRIIAPPEYVGAVTQLLFEHEAEAGNTELFSDARMSMEFLMPLRELMRNFFDELKSASSGFASLSYEIAEMRLADVVRMDILVAEEVVPAFSRVVSKKRAEKEAKQTVEKIYNILPRQMFVTKIQAKAMGRIISSKTLSALKKDVTGYLYGGDVTRKMKLLEKQKKGKKKMQARGRVNIPHDVFLKVMRSSDE